MNESAMKIELPNSWKLVPLGEFVLNEKGKKPKRESKERVTDFNIPYIDIAAFEKGIIKSWTNGEGCRFCHEDDFLMVWDGSRSGLVGKGMSGALGSTLVRINFPEIVNNYAFYFLRSKFSEINTRAKGVGIPHVDPNLLWNYRFPIPPINEQKRIVAKIEEFFSELDKGIESLKTAREQLKVYRQAVLKHAFEGKLTADWREKNKDKLESAEQLLIRIKREREEHYQQQLKEYAAAIKAWEKNGEKGKKPSKPSKPKNFTTERSTFSDVPNSWVWECIGNLNTEIFDGPFGSNLKTSDYIDEGVRVIRLENIGQMEFIEDKYSYISEEKYESIKKHTVHPGDIIFSSFIIENIRLVILPENIERAINKADCFCVRVNGTLLRKDYLATFLLTRHAYKQIESEIHGIGRPRINTTQLKSFLVPVCSSAEQDEIMAELSKTLSLILNAENTIDGELQKSEALRQSILKKAFSGQLVAQDPNDEPASVLLKRIRAEKESQSPQRKTKSKRGAA
ncbi:MAG: restriction endonuclease subunit S [Pseudobdellovibrionaceae bacterium]